MCVDCIESGMEAAALGMVEAKGTGEALEILDNVEWNWLEKEKLLQGKERMRNS
ncbi:hypothetical protein Droror1_Dr00027251, partial [Drosera rotundifolia]